MGYAFGPHPSRDQPTHFSTHSRAATDQHAMKDTPSQNPRKSLIDCHVLLAALPEGNNGCNFFTHVEKSVISVFAPEKPVVSKEPACREPQVPFGLLREWSVSDYVGKPSS